MHHEHSIFFGFFNALLTRILGPVDGAPAWWKNGVDLGGLHVAGVAPRGEHGELLGWIPDHLAMAIVVFLFCALFFLWASRRYRRDAPGPVQNVIEVFVDFLRGVIKENIAHIGHIHTAGVPGRNEIDETQELYYPAIMKAIADLKFSGYVAQEFIPKRDPLPSLRQAIDLCDV